MTRVSQSKRVSRAYFGALSAALLMLLLAGEAHAINAGNVGKLNSVRSGNQLTLSSPTNSGGSLIPLSTTTAGGGFQPAGNYGFPTGTVNGPAMALGANGEVFFPGTKLPYQAGYQVPKSALIDGLATVGCGLLSSTPAALACALAMPFAVDWLTKSKARVNPTTGALERQSDGENVLSNGLEYKALENGITTWSPTFGIAAQVYVDYLTSTSTNGSTFSVATCTSQTSCTYTQKYGSQTFGPYGMGIGTRGSNCPAGNYVTPSGRCTTSDGKAWLPASMNDIAPYLQNSPFDGRVAGEILKQGGEIAMPNPTITGPASVQSPAQVTTTTNNTNNTTTTTSTTITNNYTYNNNTINYGGSTRTTTTSETKPNPNGSGTVTTQTGTETTTTPANPNDKPSEEPSPTDTPLPPVPDLYSRKYPDGMEGIYNQYKDQAKNSQFMQLVGKLMPNLGDSGTCPTWPLNLNLASYAMYGVHDVAPPCWIWDVAAAVCIFGSLLLARALVFGG